MTLALPTKPGISTANTASNVPKEWSAAWFKSLVGNLLKGADVRNAIGANGVVVSGTIASPYATISLAGAVNTNGGFTVNGIASTKSSYNGAPASITTTDTYLISLPIPANALVAGNLFRITLYGEATSTAANAVNFSPRFGTAGTIADTAIGTTGFPAATSGSGNGWKMTFYVQFATIGSSGGANTWFDLINAAEPPAGIAQATATVNAELNGGIPVTVNTTVASQLGISVKTAAATTSLKVFSALIERLF